MTHPRFKVGEWVRGRKGSPREGWPPGKIVTVESVMGRSYFVYHDGIIANWPESDLEPAPPPVEERRAALRRRADVEGALDPSPWCNCEEPDFNPSRWCPCTPEPEGETLYLHPDTGRKELTHGQRCQLTRVEMERKGYEVDERGIFDAQGNRMCNLCGHYASLHMGDVCHSTDGDGCDICPRPKPDPLARELGEQMVGPKERPRIPVSNVVCHYCGPIDAKFADEIEAHLCEVHAPKGGDADGMPDAVPSVPPGASKGDVTPPASSEEDAGRMKAAANRFKRKIAWKRVGPTGELLQSRIAMSLALKDIHESTQAITRAHRGLDPWCCDACWSEWRKAEKARMARIVPEITL